MKAPRPKPHLLFSEWPMADNQNSEALCGRTVNKAHFIREVIAEPGMAINRAALPGVCGDCWKKEWPVARYIYLMIDGQTVRHPESEAT